MISTKNRDKISTVIEKSNYISRDLSWMQFNNRVLDQARSTHRSIFERLKFLAITASNLDEFFMIRVGSLYNYLDFNRERIDYSGLREQPFKKLLFTTAQQFYAAQQSYFKEKLIPLFLPNAFKIIRWDDLDADEKSDVSAYFMRTVFPMLTPMVSDSYHAFPVLQGKVLSFGVVSCNPADKETQRISFVQIPQNLPRFFEIHRDNGTRTKDDDYIAFLPIEEIIRAEIGKLYRNMEIVSTTLFRIIRNGDFDLEEADDNEESFITEIKEKIKTRRTGRVVRMEVQAEPSYLTMKTLKTKFEVDDENVFVNDTLIDFTGLWQIVNHLEFKTKSPALRTPINPLFFEDYKDKTMLEVLRKEDILLHHPYNNFEPVLQLLEQAAGDPDVLAIKMTLYRIAKNSRITEALLKAAESGKTVSVLFEVKARFDEERNIQAAERLQKAGCFVIYGISKFKTHTKLLLIVKKDADRVVRYVHLSSGNYNEDTSKLYTDLGLLTTNEVYGQDVSEFFNVITGHSLPHEYQNLLTAPRDLRKQLLNLIRQEAENAKNGLPCGIVIKVNSLEDKDTIDELYKASQAGVTIKLIIRGICCIRPHRKNLSENISVRSLVGDLLEHTRVYYFHNNGNPKVYGGSADIMVRSFDKRIESLFLITDERMRQQAINVLVYNLKDNQNAYEMQENSNYVKVIPAENEKPFNIQKAFYEVTEAEVMEAKLF
ncbi:MAG: polyphosphate kinase 1 [Verrucomicrobia bacterium]|nr:polyphosphate kinase 1 [Cytophagales bacterium]